VQIYTPAKWRGWPTDVIVMNATSHQEKRGELPGRQTTDCGVFRSNINFRSKVMSNKEEKKKNVPIGPGGHRQEKREDRSAQPCAQMERAVVVPSRHSQVGKAARCCGRFSSQRKRRRREKRRPSAIKCGGRCAREPRP